MEKDEIFKVKEGIIKAMIRKGKPGIRMLETKINLKGAFKTKKHIGLDMGGSNFRVSLIELSVTGTEPDSRRSFKIIASKKWKIPQEAKTSTIFKWSALRIKEFVDENGFNAPNTIGFTFSFPVKQNFLHEGFLLQWNKAFNAPEFIGKDVARILEKECADLGIQLRVGTVMNDTISTLLTGMFLFKDCRIAVILGSGTNAALYLKQEDQSVTVINTEWAAYGEHPEDYLPRSDLDRKLDAKFETGRQFFEKMTSGLYLPKLYHLQKGEGSELSTKDLSDQDEKSESIRYFSNRSVDLITAGILAAVDFLKITGEVTIVIDGSLYEKYQGYAERLQKRINELSPDKKISIKLAKDFSSIGSIIPL